MKLNGIKLDEYITHPRVLEIRFILFFHNIKRNYDYDTALNLIKSLCGAFRSNFSFISTIIANEYNIMRLSKTNKQAWYRDMVFAGYLYGESRWVLAKKYLNMNKQSLYRADYDLNVENYVDQKFLDSLDERVTVCGVPHMALEVIRFMESMEHFLAVVGNVAIPKT